MQRSILAYDANCASCSKVAAQVASDDRLEVKGLDDREVRQLLDEAKPGWRFRPTLISVDGDHVETFTGPSMAARLVMLIGPRKAGKVVKALGEEASNDGATRRAVLGRGILATGTVLLGGLAASDPATADRARARGAVEMVNPALAGKIEHLDEVQQASRILGHATRVTYSPGRPNIYVVDHHEPHAYTAVEEQMLVAVSYRLVAVNGDPVVDYLRPDGSVIGRRNLMTGKPVSAKLTAQAAISIQCGNYCYTCVFGNVPTAQRAAYCAACGVCAGRDGIVCAIDCKGSGGPSNYARCMTACLSG
jgi:hypothetical protein